MTSLKMHNCVEHWGMSNSNLIFLQILLLLQSVNEEININKIYNVIILIQTIEIKVNWQLKQHLPDYIIKIQLLQNFPD